ncbi:MAG: dTDP-4-dehydrorhamnose reductase [Sphaerochaetaceae bacterium]|nr:dTDP-4-dehydrorhamnose reductase [Sphaerochaetaceae bacterium]
MKILLTGGSGQLGYDITRCVEQNNIHTLLSPSSKELDLADEKSIKAYCDNAEFDAILHSGAYTKVDQAQTEKDRCFAINTNSTIQLMREAKKRDIPFVFISTDYVFDGSSKIPYKTFFKKNPLNVYGLSKAMAEDVIINEYYDKSIIIRTSTVFGINGNNFIKTMLSLLQTHKSLNVVSDQVSSPTYTKDLAPVIIKILENRDFGIYHITGSGECSKSDLVREIIKIKNIDACVNDVPSSFFLLPAPRPLYSVLNNQTLRARGYELLPLWNDALKRYISEFEQRG